MKKIAFFIVLVIFAMATPVLAADPPILSVPAAFTAQAPVIDGVLDDSAWLTASQMGAKAIVDQDNLSTKISDFPRVVYLAYDNQSLYIGFYISTQDSNALTIDADSYWNNDEVEVALVCPEPYGYNKVTVIADGTVVEESGTGQVRAAVSKTATSWTVEIMMPFECLWVDAPKAGDTWRIGIYGHQITDGAMWLTWNPTYGKFTNKNRFGYLVFLDN